MQIKVITNDSLRNIYRFYIYSVNITEENINYSCSLQQNLISDENIYISRGALNISLHSKLDEIFRQNSLNTSVSLLHGNKSICDVQFFKAISVLHTCGIIQIETLCKANFGQSVGHFLHVVYRAGSHGTTRPPNWFVRAS